MLLAQWPWCHDVKTMTSSLTLFFDLNCLTKPCNYFSWTSAILLLKRHRQKNMSYPFLHIISKLILKFLNVNPQWRLKSKLITQFWEKIKSKSMLWNLTKFDHHCVKSVQIRNYFWSVFSCIRTESPYSVRIQENTDQK